MEIFGLGLFNVLAPTLGTIFTGLVSWGVVELTKFVRTKTKNEAVNDALGHVCHTIETTVSDMGQTMKASLKESMVDGKLSKDELRDIKRIAVAKVNAQIPGAMEKMAGLAVNSFSDFVDSRVGKAISDQKK